MNKIRIASIVLAVVVLATNAVYAWPKEGYGQRGPAGKDKIFEELNLTPEQQKRLEKNRQAQREEAKRLFLEMKDKQEKLRAALKDPSATKASVEPYAKEVKAVQARLIDHRIKGILTVKQILTPEQFAKFNQIIEKRIKERPGRMNNKRGPDPDHGPESDQIPE